METILHVDCGRKFRVTAFPDMNKWAPDFAATMHSFHLSDPPGEERKLFEVAGDPHGDVTFPLVLSPAQTDRKKQ